MVEWMDVWMGEGMHGVERVKGMEWHEWMDGWMNGMNDWHDMTWSEMKWVEMKKRMNEMHAWLDGWDERRMN